MGDDSLQYSVTFKAVEDADLSLIRQVSFDSGIVDYEEPVTSFTRTFDTEDDMSDEEDYAQEAIEK